MDALLRRISTDGDWNTCITKTVRTSITNHLLMLALLYFFTLIPLLRSGQTVSLAIQMEYLSAVYCCRLSCSDRGQANFFSCSTRLHAQLKLIRCIFYSSLWKKKPSSLCVKSNRYSLKGTSCAKKEEVILDSKLDPKNKLF